MELESQGASMTWFALVLARAPLAAFVCMGLGLGVGAAAAPVRAQGAKPRQGATNPRGPSRPSFDPRTALLEAPVVSLTAASARGDRTEVARWADRLGPARLATLLARRERATVLAALDGTRSLEGNVRLLPTSPG